MRTDHHIVTPACRNSRISRLAKVKDFLPNITAGPNHPAFDAGFVWQPGDQALISGKRHPSARWSRQTVAAGSRVSSRHSHLTAGESHRAIDCAVYRSN